MRLAPIEGTFEEQKIDYKLVIKHGEPGPTIVSFANRGGSTSLSSAVGD